MLHVAWQLSDPIATRLAKLTDHVGHEFLLLLAGILLMLQIRMGSMYQELKDCMVSQ